MTTFQAPIPERRRALRALLGAAAGGMLLAACAATPTRESTGELIDDSAITAKVKTALITDKQVSAADVSVDTFKGRVLLAGFVRTPQERYRAETVARSVKGVKAVHNSIEVR